MTELANLAERATPASRGRRRFALELLGVGIFVSAYVHIAAGPALYGVASSEDVGLFVPAQNRSSIELTMSLASSASEASAETAVRIEPVKDAPLEAEKLEKARETLDEDPLTAPPTELVRSEPVSSLVAVSRDSAASAILPPQADRREPLPLERRVEETAPHAAEMESETASPPRASSVDSPPQAASAVRLGAESENLPELVLNQPPVYPAEALSRGVEGTTVVRAKISRTGSVLETSIAASSGSSLLDQAAEDAVRTWTFRPALRWGLAVESEVGVPVVFSIREALEARTDPAASAGRAASEVDPR